MRAPRYRFPDEVRSATRAMAERMVRQGDTPGSAEALDRWISANPDVEAPLRKGGYGEQFDAAELMPLLQAQVVKAGGSLPEADAPVAPAKSRSPVLVLAGALLLGALLALLFLS